MTLILETGAGLSNSNTYVSLAAAGAYNGAREPNRSIWIQHDNVELEAALIDARRALDAMFGWRGSVKTNTQALKWPRNYAYDNDQRLLANDAVPTAVADAQAQLAYRILEERDAMSTGTQERGVVIAESIGDWSAKYADAKAGEWSELSRILLGLTDSGPSASGFSQQKRVRWS